MNKKMADIGIDPFGEHDRTEEPTDENIPLTPRGGSFVTRVQVHLASDERETSFRGEIVQVYFTKNT